MEYRYTYVLLERGFAYLVAVFEWYSRRVLSWRISNSMEAAFCVDCLEDALREHGKPEVFNSDQASQFNGEVFTDVLKREDIAIGMDGRSRAYDNIFVERLWRSVKHEDVYLNGYATMGELLIGLTKYFAFYNTERLHQSLENKTPQEVYKTSSGGGEMIVDKCRVKESLPVALRSSGTAFEEVRIEGEPAIPITKTGAAPFSSEKSRGTENAIKSVLTLGGHFTSIFNLSLCAEKTFYSRHFCNSAVMPLLGLDFYINTSDAAVASPVPELNRGELQSS